MDCPFGSLNWTYCYYLHVEAFQVAMGVIEFPAMLCAAYLLFFTAKA